MARELYKVYAKCAHSVSPIKIITGDEDEIFNAIDDIINARLDCGFTMGLEYEELEDDDKFAKAYEKVAADLKQRLENGETLYCGDYYIAYDTETPERPDSCGWTDLD